MTSIFISYARGDDALPFDPATSFVARLHRDLTARGFEVWFDRMGDAVARTDVAPGNAGCGRRGQAVAAGRRAKSRRVGFRAARMAVRAPGRQGGHPHLNLQVAIGNYVTLFEEMGMNDAEIGQKLNELLAEYVSSLG